MATAKLWHYRGTQDEVNPTGLQREPYLSRQTVSTSGTAASSAPSPEGSHLIRVEVLTATRYRVNLAGETPVAADAEDPSLKIGPEGWNWIACPPGSSLSLIEA